jgi:exonuclease III
MKGAGVLAMSIDLISWNVAARIGVFREQVDAIAERHPDIVALQEVTARTASRLKNDLACRGFYHCADSISITRDAAELAGARRYGALIASRWPIQRLSRHNFKIPWKECVLSVTVQTPGGPLEIHTTHIPPGSSNGWIKVETLEGIFARLACHQARPRILCGDFNTPMLELDDGCIVTWGQRMTPSGEIRITRKWPMSAGGGLGARSTSQRAGRTESQKPVDRWDRAERAILEGLAEFDLIDAYRLLNGNAARDYSWYWRGKGRRVGRRFDHVFASRQLNPVRCLYIHEWRESGLSDHSAIEVCFEPAAAS